MKDYGGIDNYEAFKKGRGMKDKDICFIIPSEEDNIIGFDAGNGYVNIYVGLKYIESFTYEELYKRSKFLGTKAECENNLTRFPGCKAI